MVGDELFLVQSFRCARGSGSGRDVLAATVGLVTTNSSLSLSGRSRAAYAMCSKSSCTALSLLSSFGLAILCDTRFGNVIGDFATRGLGAFLRFFDWC